MTLTKNKMVREIGQRTRLKNRDIQAMIEALVEVWTEELVAGGVSNWKTSSCWRRRLSTVASGTGRFPAAKHRASSSV
jgi:hypothetical protein